MTEAADTNETPLKRKSKLPLLLGVLLLLAGGGAGFYAVYSGLILTRESNATTADGHSEKQMPKAAAASGDVVFVPIEPLVISLDRGTHLRFRAQLEVQSAYKSEVEHLLPRVIDVLNGYLRAVDITDLQDNAALVKLRAQMLRRVQVVTDADRVSDLLIMEFVVN